MPARRVRTITATLGAATTLLVLTALTVAQLAPLPKSLDDLLAADAAAIVSRDGEWLAARYAGAWNTHRRLADGGAAPALLEAAIIAAEDQRFASHHGPDWLARAHALWQNLVAGRVVRGASTITEQVVRMVHPRPRTPWSRWLEGIDAWRFEQRYGKAAIFMFYLDQVPYGAHRRGVQQASNYYFGRDVSSTSVAEQLALAVLPRAPSRLSPRTNSSGLLRRVRWLGRRMRDQGQIEAAELTLLRRQMRRTLDFASAVGADASAPAPSATHFVELVRQQIDSGAHSAPERGRWRATLDSAIQANVQDALRARLAALRKARAGAAAGIVFEHGSGDIRAWTTVTAEGTDSTIDAVRVPRLAGSTLKPLLYALALRGGRTPTSQLSDAPLVRPVGSGLHAYRNYGRAHFGVVSLREALGSSLNLPAVRMLGELGPEQFVHTLHALGLRSLTAHPAHYGEGLALGNAEVSLLALARAYGVVARGGRALELRALEEAPVRDGESVFAPASAAALRDVLSDANARRLEFAHGGVLDMPRGIAVKTGTSSGHRDAWTVAFDQRFVVAVWMGNLAGQPMRGVSGAGGPALAVRAIMAALPAAAQPQRAINRSSPRSRAVSSEVGRVERGPRIVLPSDGLRIAMDPRIPDALEALPLTLAGVQDGAVVEWWLDGERLDTHGNRAPWQVRPGDHVLYARVFGSISSSVTTRAVRFSVR